MTWKGYATIGGGLLLMASLLMALGCKASHDQSDISRIEFARDGVVCYASRGGNSYLSCVKVRP